MNLYSANCPKYLIYFLNFIIAACGILLLTFGIIYTLKENNGVKVFWDISFAPLVLTIGAALLAVAILGCCAVYYQKTCLLTTYSAILVALFAVQLTFGIIAVDKIINKDDFLDYVKKTMWDLFEKNDSQSIADFRDIELEFKCCGVNSFEDRNVAADGYPPSCCEGTTPCLAPVQVGCAAAFTDAIKENILIIGAAGLAFGIVEVGTAVFTFMWIRYRDDYTLARYFPWCCC